MVNENLHPADQELLLLADGELPARRAALVRQHLAACWDCRTRMAEIEGIIGEFMRMHRETLDRRLPPSAGPRAQLKSRLAEFAQSAPHDPWRWLRFGLNPRAVSIVGILALIAALGGVFHYWQVMKSEPVVSLAPGPLPNPHLTPGAMTAAAISDICSMNHDDVVRTVPSVLQQTVFQEYGMRKQPAANYEIDFLISPGLGGAEDIRNLWPEPRYNTVWNSFVKDQLEDYLHQSVCGGRISLGTAQQDIAGNWISAYKKYFHSEKPLENSPTSDGRKVLRPMVSDVHSVSISVVWRARVASLLKGSAPVPGRNSTGRMEKRPPGKEAMISDRQKDPPQALGRRAKTCGGGPTPSTGDRQAESQSMNCS